MENFLFALLLSTLAGLSTTIGSLFAFIVRKPNPRFISFIMGFSAGVMILVSFVELLQQSIANNGLFLAMIFFFLGMIIMLIIDMGVSHYYEYEHEIVKESPIDPQFESIHHKYHIARHGFRHQHSYRHKNPQYDGLKKISLLIAIGIFIHNVPEGMATFLGALEGIKLGVILTIAIALHNIPEGIAVAVPVYASNNQNKRKAFLWSFITGLSEPLGAIIVWLVLFPFINEYVIDTMLAIVAGVMVYISLDELLPVSKSLGKEHISILGIIAGMIVISISLLLLQ
ncbi:MAG: zinc transporter ZupT [Candidatus Hermodarchaeota archaeon]